VNHVLVIHPMMQDLKLFRQQARYTSESRHRKEGVHSTAGRAVEITNNNAMGVELG
jgi:hypothetical protein